MSDAEPSNSRLLRKRHFFSDRAWLPSWHRVFEQRISLQKRTGKDCSLEAVQNEGAWAPRRTESHPAYEKPFCRSLGNGAYWHRRSRKAFRILFKNSSEIADFLKSEKALNWNTLRKCWNRKWSWWKPTIDKFKRMQEPITDFYFALELQLPESSNF